MIQATAEDGTRVAPDVTYVFVECCQNALDGAVQSTSGAHISDSVLPLPVNEEITSQDLISRFGDRLKQWALNNVANAFTLPSGPGRGHAYVPFCMDLENFEFGIYTQHEDRMYFLAEVPGKPGSFSFQPEKNTTRLRSTADKACDRSQSLRVASLVFPDPTPEAVIDTEIGVDCYLSPVSSTFMKGGSLLSSEAQLALEEVMETANIRGYLPGLVLASTPTDP